MAHFLTIIEKANNAHEDDEILAVLGSGTVGAADKVFLVCAHAVVKEGIKRLMERGINYPDRTPLSKYNATADQGLRFLECLSGLYASKFNFSYEIKEI